MFRSHNAISVSLASSVLLFTLSTVLNAAETAPKPETPRTPTAKATPAKPAVAEKKAPEIPAAVAKLQQRLKTPLSKTFSTMGKDSKGVTLVSILDKLAKTLNTTITLDPNLPKTVGAQQIAILAPEKTPLNEVLGLVLAASDPFLRYSIDEKGIFVSTAAGVAKKALAPKKASRAAQASRPMSDIEMLNALKKADGRGETKFVHIDRPLYKVESNDTFLPPAAREEYSETPPESASWYYSSTPYFPRPEIMILRENGQLTNPEKVNAIIQLMERNPNLTARQILRRLAKK